MTRWTAMKQVVVAGVAGVAVGVVGAAQGQTLSMRHVAAVNTGAFYAMPKSLGMELGYGGGVLLGFGSRTTGNPDFSPIFHFTSDQAAPEVALLPASQQMVFDIDAYGSLSYAMTRAFVSGVVVGDDLGDAVDPLDRFTLRQVEFQNRGPATTAYPIAYAMDRQGLPAFASHIYTSSAPAQNSVWRFNPQTNHWDTTTPPQEGYRLSNGPLIPQAIDFTLDNRLIHAFEAVTDSVPTLRVTLEAPTDGWIDLAAGSTGYQQPSGMSVAVSEHTGEVAFAFVDGSSQLTVGRYDGATTVYETVADTPTRLTTHSLRYDDQGRLALVYGEGLSDPGSHETPLVLSRRTSTGQWTQTDLGVDALYGEVVFGGAGELYIGAVLDGRVALLSDDIPSLAGDVDLSGVADLADLLPFVVGLTDPPSFRETYGFDAALTGDVNGDGLFNFDDILPFAETLNLSESQTQALIRLVPEPGVGVVLLAMLAGVGPRRVFVRR